MNDLKTLYTKVSSNTIKIIDINKNGKWDSINVLKNAIENNTIFDFVIKRTLSPTTESYEKITAYLVRSKEIVLNPYSNFPPVELPNVSDEELDFYIILDDILNKEYSTHLDKLVCSSIGNLSAVGDDNNNYPILVNGKLVRLSINSETKICNSFELIDYSEENENTISITEEQINKVIGMCISIAEIEKLI